MNIKENLDNKELLNTFFDVEKGAL